ncbi:hypothetical protein ACFQDN_21690 [Pseudomonas asuensis]|uniref:Uncharacterized protein n=1 Tax=Pseudomonas asuensis TaxID=1825787 RepID=A0ABQ2H3B9_9PSED|nr:hypothetical protein [Pseudomonas asuensis]GGM25039.1 hypothetical protein GCM10009425_39820 [Pseudomonas asuensis]
MTFYDCLMECAITPTLVSEFNRLTGRHVGEKLVRHPLEEMIDKATGYEEMRKCQQDDDLLAFIEFCHECVWVRLPLQN